MDAMLPPDMAKKAEDVGVNKSGMNTPRMFVLAVLAGAFISFGAVFATTVAAGTAKLGHWPKPSRSDCCR